jgi:DNA-binding CsgD family transcriptional regulator
MRRGRPPYDDILTPREWEVLDLLRLGLTNAEIAQRLGISEGGVKFHVQQILSKLGVGSRQEAARWAEAEGGPITVRSVPVRTSRGRGGSLRAGGRYGRGVQARGLEGHRRTTRSRPVLKRDGFRSAAPALVAASRATMVR